MLIQEFFADFLALFFAPWAERLDASAVEWLEQEAFLEPPQGPRRVLDLVGKLPTRKGVASPRPGEPDSWLALVHIEIESPDKVAPLRPRMFRSYVYLRDRYDLPVLPIGLFLKVALDGVGVDAYEEDFWEFQSLRFQYLYVGLPGLNAVEYVEGDNWLGVALAALMKMKREEVALLGAEALRKITTAPLSEKKRLLLGDCVEAYLPIDDSQRAEFDRFLMTKSYEGIRAMNVTSYDKGMAEGERRLLKNVLLKRFQSLTPAIEAKVRNLSSEQINEMMYLLLNNPAASLHDLGLED